MMKGEAKKERERRKKAIKEEREERKSKGRERKWKKKILAFLWTVLFMCANYYRMLHGRGL